MAMQTNMIVTTNDYNRLMGLLKFSVSENNKSDIVFNLYQRLTSAKKLPQENISNGIVTMNSKVLLKDIKSGKKIEVTITYPQDAEPKDRRVSVLSNIGLALLGRKENEVVSWRIPSGVGLFEVEKVTYQPEAAGHFYL